jgi:lysophospholipase L1-like esterase
MAILNPSKIGLAAWDEFTTLNGQPATGDPSDPTTSQATLDGMNAIGFPWYHTWHDTSLTGNQGAIKWIPAWNTIAEVNTESLARFKASGELVIASSEPWNSFGGTYPTISPDECIAIWPQLMAIGNRLTSPSISGPTDGNDWLADFMSKINARGYRVDVINVHYYSTDGNLNAFRDYLQSVHNLYGRPLFIGEWARYVNWGIQGKNPPQVDPAVQAAFAVAASQMMDTLDFVEKQAWYAAGTGGGGVLYLGSEVLNADGSPSIVGRAFKEMLAAAGSGTFVGGYVCSGDSLTAGYVVPGNPTVNPYPTQLASLTGLPAANFGVNGWQSYITDGNYPTREGPAYNAATANVLILEVGVNDIYAGNRSVSDVDTSVRSFCAQGRASGYKVYVMTIAAASMNTAQETERLAINSDRRANWSAYCDGLIDIAANSAFSDTTNATYYQSDGVHWTTAADAVVANLVKVATLTQTPIVVPPSPNPPSVPAGPTMASYMNAANLILNPDQGTAISPVTGPLPTYSSLLNARNIHRRT